MHAAGVCRDIVEHRFTLRSFRYMLNVCQLYDYHNHRWLNWTGEPTSSSPIDVVPEPAENGSETDTEKVRVTGVAA